jgi:hypothetical protein
MSDPVKTSDVEDVLFSIRRLVSETPEPEEMAQTETATADALFLTSAHRVNDPATEPEQVDLEDMTTGLTHFREAVNKTDERVEDLPSLDDMFADKEPARRLHLSEVVSDEVPLSDEFIEDISNEGTRQWASDPDTDKLSDFATPDDNFGPVEDNTNDQDGDKASEEAVPEDWMSDAETDLSSEFEEALQEETLPETKGEVEAEPEQRTDAAQADEEVEVDVVEVEDVHVEPDHEESDDEETVEFEDDHVEHDDIEEVAEGEALAAEAEAAVADAHEEPETSNVVDLSDFDETLVDEDALRDMVAEIVREELSGELGERITRNVRKLVRREIHRAMLARDFD